MTTYLFLYAISLYCIARNQDRIASFALLILMFLVTILRSESVGADTWTYLYDFGEHIYDTGFGKDSRGLEVINNLLYYYVYNFNLDRRIILYFYGTITYFFLFLTSRRYKVRLSYLLFFYLTGSFFIMSLNICRQVASVSIVLYAIPLLFDNERLKIRDVLCFSLLLVLAGLIHASSLVFLFLLVFRFLKIRKEVLIIVTGILSFLLLFNIIPFEQLMIWLTPEVYASFKTDVNRNLAVTFFGYFYRAVIIIVQLCILWQSNDKKYEVLYAFSVMITCVSMGLDSDVARVFLVFSGIIMLFQCRYFTNNSKDFIARILLILLIVSSSYFWYTGTSANLTVNPYRTMFSDSR